MKQREFQMGMKAVGKNKVGKGAPGIGLASPPVEPNEDVSRDESARGPGLLLGTDANGHKGHDENRPGGVSRHLAVVSIGPGEGQAGGSY